MLFRKPEGINSVSPINELREDLSKYPKVTATILIVNFILADFLSGFIAQLVYRIGHPRAKIGIINCFIKGINPMWILTIIFYAVFTYFAFRVYRTLRRSYEKNYDDNYLRSKKETYGGAHFQSTEEMEKNGFILYDSLEEAEGDIFGITKENKYAVFTYPAGMNRNEVYMGAPGSGKSASIVKTKLYQNVRAGNSVIVTDSKGSLYDETSAVVRSYGYSVKAIMLKPAWFKHSDAFNMFENIKPDDEEIDSKADVIANTIIKNTSTERELGDYWSKNEFNLIKCVVMHVATDPQHIRQKKNNLPEVYTFLTKNNPVKLAGIFRNYPEDSPIRQCYETFAEAEDGKQGQIVNGVLIRLSKLTNKYLRQVLSHSEMKMIEPMKKRCVYYIIISDTDDSYKFISSMLFSTMINAMCDYSDSLTKEAKKNQISVQFICDEHKATGGIEGLPIKIATLRSRKIGMTLMLQDKGQLDSLYGEIDASSILNCCTVKGLLSTNDPVTAQYFSDLLGTVTVLVENLRFYENATDVVHAHDNIQKTLGEGTRPLKQPEELMNDKFGRSHVIYVIAGMPPLQLEKCFAEKQGEALHPLEKEAVKLGERKCNRHKPKWRKELEEAQKKMEEEAASYMETETVETELTRPAEKPFKTHHIPTVTFPTDVNFPPAPHIEPKEEIDDFDPGFEEENIYEPDINTL